MASVLISKSTGGSARKAACLFFALVATWQFPAPAESPRIARVPAAPAWVKPQPVDVALPVDNDQVGNGIWDLLVDKQTNVNESTSYEHYASKFLSENGVQDGSRITITFDPAYETLTLHKLVVYRDGKAMDRLMTQDIKLLQREAGLDRQLYDGRLSAVMLLEDIRVGDTIEYSYTVHGVNPIFGGSFFDDFSARWDSPLHRLYHRVLWPSNRKLAVKSFVEDFAPVVTRSGPVTEYVWEKSDIAPLISDGDLPSWYEPYQWVQLSEFQSWSDVNNWAMKLLAVPDKAPDNLRAEIDLLRAISDPKARAFAALQFVQRNIRYLGIEVGAHSHKPYPIATVLQRRFGDCKDKALLLSALLRQVGLEAYPSLVDTEVGRELPTWIPTPLAFDHAIVQLRLGGHVYWLDPTRSNQGGGLDDLYFPDYGEALVVKAGTDSLTKITPGGYNVLGTEITENYVIADFKGEAKLNVHSIFRGRDAERTRAWLADTSRAEIEKTYLNYYAKDYQYIKTASAPVFSDDLAHNVITCDQGYTISHFWQPHSDNPDRLYGDFYPRWLRDLISKPDTQVRTMPLEVPYPTRMTQTIHISTPEGMTFTNEESKIDDPAFKFAYKRTRGNNQVTLHYSYETLEDHVDAARAPDYLKNVSDLLDNLDYELSCDKDMALNAAPPAVESKVPLSTASPQSLSPEQEWLIFSPFVLIAAILLFRFLRSLQRSAVAGAEPESPLHRCAFCGKTEHSAPDTEFRVAMDGEEYCRRHLPGKN